jgi:flagellar hook protein FlgE
MSLYGMLRTSVSGMNAQSNLLSTVSDNIAKSGTAGYKSSSTEFSSLLLQTDSSSYESGSVVTDVRHAISKQGNLSYSGTSTDLAVQGNGFFLVQDPSGQTLLTRAGGFQVDAATGNLTNSAGLTLMGYDIADGKNPNVVLNGAGGLAAINLQNTKLAANPSTTGAFAANLPSNAAVVAAPTAGANLVASSFSQKSSLVAYDNVGNQVTLDIYMSKTIASPATWEVAVFDQADAPATGNFPYSSAALATQTLTFDTYGNLASGGSISLGVPGGQTLAIDMSGMTQLAANYTPLTASVNGNAPSSVAGVTINKDGTVYATDSNGRQSAIFKIPLATVESPDHLTPVAGNAFIANQESGAAQVGFAETAGVGSVISGATEQSNVDMASELTKMIVAQRDYTANSKVFQTGTELLDVLMNLKR